MDQYSLMCSKLRQILRVYSDSTAHFFLRSNDPPTLEQLVGMMPKDIEWDLYYTHIKNSENEYHLYIYNEIDDPSKDKRFVSTILILVMLQALAWVKWGKEWDNEKGEWRDEN